MGSINEDIACNVQVSTASQPLASSFDMLEPDPKLR